MEYLAESNGLITADYCRQQGIPTIYLTRLTREGVLRRAAPGIYLAEHGDEDQFYFFQYRYRKAVFSYETALFLLGATDKIIQDLDVTVSYNYKFNKKPAGVNVHYVKESWLTLGEIEVLTMAGNPVRAYSYERTICDFVMNKGEIDPELYIQTMRRYPHYEKRDLHLLYSIANEMNVTKKIRDIVELTHE